MTPATPRKSGPKNPPAPIPESDVDEALEVSAKLSGEFGDVTMVDPESIMVRMASRLHQADSIDDLFDSLKGKSSDELDGKAFRFRDVQWQAYDAGDRTIPLGVCDVIDLATGEETEFVTTAFMLTNFLRRAQVIGAFPFDARIVAKKTNRGQTALNLERV